MPSVVDVCNKALDKLGHGPITNLGDGTKAANLCDRNWPLVRDEVLRDHPWNFAVTRANLAPVATAPAWGFTNAFNLPSDCLRLLEVKDQRSEDYQVESRQILSDADVLYIRYIRQVTDPNRMDATVVDLMAARLALELCESLTQSNTKLQLMWRQYEESLVRAKRVDGRENPPTLMEEDDWIAVRY